MTYREIYDNLNAGKHYYDDILGYEHTVLSLSVTKYIHYSYFGSSAVKNLVAELTWVIECIFEMNADTFTSRYKLSK